MKELTLVLLSLVGCISAYLIRVPTSNIAAQTTITPLGWVQVQKMLLPLLDNVCEESKNVMVIQLANDFTLDVSNGDYTKADVIENLRNLKTKGLLPKGEIFSEYNTTHMNELKALFEVFFYARDFDTFYRAAVWARQNVNCGLFIDALYLAIVNRRDTSKLSVPAPYELLPNYFINKDIVVRASLLLTADNLSTTPDADMRVEGNSYILNTNYTAELDAAEEDSKLAYFREDIGLNAYYFIRKLRYSPWFNTPTVADNLYGERMFMMMRQFAARYDLERYSHGFPELEGFDWESTMAYDPMLIYSNGNEFDHRAFSNVLSENEDIAHLKTIEIRIADAVTHLRQAGHTKTQILGHLMDVLVTSDKSYETMCRMLLGYDRDATERHYSVLDHYMTTLRDPIFWRINKKIVQLINNALNNLPSYSRSELYFPGVEILNIETKKIMTTFDDFQFDVTDALKTSTANTTFQVKVAQPRLNHKPFSVKLNISSLVSKKGLVKIYIGPKMMPGELAMKKHLFVLLDSFETNLKRGYNVLSRSSEEMTSFSDDFISLRALRKKVEDAEFGLDALPLQTVDSQIGYPTRLILPKGLPNGLPLQIFVFVAPLTKGTLSGSFSTNTLELNTAIQSPGYPLDLPIEIRQLFGLPNALVREISVTHKSETAKPGNGAKLGPGGKPGISGRPGAGGRPGENNYNYDQIYDNYQTDFKPNGDIFNENIQNIDVDSFYDDTLSVRGLLDNRPDFTYRKTDTKNYGGNKNQFGKEDWVSKRTDKSLHYKTDSNLPTNNESDLINSSTGIPTTVTYDNYIDRVTGHGLLGARPDFSNRKKDLTKYKDEKTLYKNNGDYVFKKTNKWYETQIEDKKDINLLDKVIFNTNVYEGDETIYDDIVTHGPLGGTSDMKLTNDDNYLMKKQMEYIKKEEDRTAKREQKKEKYIAKGEQMKEEALIKKDHKIEDHLAKREKQLKELIKKGIVINSTEKDVDDFKIFSDADYVTNKLNNDDTILFHDNLRTVKSDGLKQNDVTEYETIQVNKIKKKDDTNPNKAMETTNNLSKTKNEYDVIDDDDIITHGPLGSSSDTQFSNNNIYSMKKKTEYIKKGEDRTAKREQKKEKYVTKGDQVKEEAVAKKDHKIEENLAKREKQLKDFIKKSVILNNTEKDIDVISAEK